MRLNVDAPQRRSSCTPQRSRVRPTLIGIGQGQRDARVDAPSVWLLTQRQQREKAPETDYPLKVRIALPRHVFIFTLSPCGGPEAGLKAAEIG